MKDLARLSDATVGRARVAVPAHDRSAVPSIVHLGVGAFAQAHLGVYADDLLCSGWPATIRGVSLRGPGAQERLDPQDGWYSVTEREVGPDGPIRVVGAFTSVGTGPRAAVDAIATPTTRLVTLTVTERGYDIDDDELAAGSPRSAVAVLAAGLARRRAARAPGMVVASLDNVLDNGRMVRDAVIEAAGRIDPTLPSWVGDEVRFPSSVVDRMVPATNSTDIAEISGRIGVADWAAVTAEHHRSWVIEATDGLPPLADVGVDVVNDIAGFQRRKLWLLNGPHSASAYCGMVVGATTIATAVTHPIVAVFVQKLADEILEVADLPAALDGRRYATDTIGRFANPNLGHTCVQVGTDGSRKLPQRLLPAVRARRTRGLSTDHFAVVVAAWIAAAAGIAVAGTRLSSVDDPLSTELRAAANDPRRAVAVALGPNAEAGFTNEVVTALHRLIGEGSAVLGASS